MKTHLLSAVNVSGLSYLPSELKPFHVANLVAPYRAVRIETQAMLLVIILSAFMLLFQRCLACRNSGSS